MADRYSDYEPYGREEGRGRARWADEGMRRRGGRMRRMSDDDIDEERYGREDERQGFGGYGGGYGQGMSGQSYGGGTRDRAEWERDFGSMRGYGQGGYGRYDEPGWSQGYGRYQGQAQYGLGQGQYGQSQFGQGYGAGQYGRENLSGPSMRAFSAPNYMQGGYGQGWTPPNQQGYGQQGGQWGRFKGRGPKNYTRSDERIRDDINDRLTDEPDLDASEIEVKVNGGEVILSGAVDSREDKRRAEDCVEAVSGVKHVQNNLRVQNLQGGEETTRATRQGKGGGDGGRGEKMQ